MTAESKVLYGMASLTRASMPAFLADFKFLPSVDVASLPEDSRLQYDANLEAYRLFVLEPDVSLAEIRRRTGVHEKQLYRLIARVVTKAEDGLIQGLRGLIPGKHLKAYTRTAIVARSSKLESSTAAGALQQVLTRFPAILTWLKREARRRVERLRKDEFRSIRKPTAQLHGEFLDRCRAAGITDDQWPFNQDYRGYRSFARLLKRLEMERQAGHPKAGGQQRDDACGDDKPLQWPIALQPFTVVQFDGHKVDLRVTIAVADPFGMETLMEISRIWILVLTDVRTRAILGYSLALGVEYNKDDFAQALQASLVPHRRVQLTIPGLRVKEGGGFPTDVQPELAYHRWTWFQFDEARAHLADDSLDRLTKVLGSWTVAGRLGEPNDRALEERLFGILEECGFHRLPGTLGSSPGDPRRKLGDVGRDLGRIIRLDELEQIVYVLLANRNGESQAGLGGRTALESLRYLTGKPEFLLQTLPHTKRHQLFLLREAVLVTIRGRKSVAHVNFEGVRYTSDTLARKPELIGTKLRIYYMARDIRKVHAFFLDASELGILIAAKPWRTTPHSLRQRREILRMKRLGKVSWGAQDDPVEKYILKRRAEAKHNKRAANKIAQMQATIAAANADTVEKTSPFGSFVHEEPAHCTQESDAMAAEAARRPGQDEGGAHPRDHPQDHLLLGGCAHGLAVAAALSDGRPPAEHAKVHRSHAVDRQPVRQKMSRLS